MNRRIILFFALMANTVLLAQNLSSASTNDALTTTTAPVTANIGSKMNFTKNGSIDRIAVSPVSSVGIIPEILYYKFNGSGTTVPNLASAPPVGTATANIMGDITQGGSAICNGTLIGSGQLSSTNYLDTAWNTN